MSNDNLKAQVEEYNEDFIDSEEKELINDLYTALQEAEQKLCQCSCMFDEVEDALAKSGAALQLSQEQNKVAVEALEYVRTGNYVDDLIAAAALAKIKAMGEA